MTFVAPVHVGDLLTLHHLYFGTTNPSDRLPIDAAIAAELQAVMSGTGHYKGPINGAWDDTSKESFWDFVGTENLEERWAIDESPDLIDPVALNFIRQRFGKK